MKMLTGYVNQAGNTLQVPRCTKKHELSNSKPDKLKNITFNETKLMLASVKNVRFLYRLCSAPATTLVRLA